MPELPELEAFKSYVKSHCLHKVIAQVTSHDTAIIKDISFATFKKTLIGTTFTHVERRGKYLIIDIKPSDKKLVLHFALTGSLEFTKNMNADVRFSVVAFIFKDHSVLHFKSVRKFEKIWLVEDADDIKGIANLGPDALALSHADFIGIMNKNKSKNIKALLMDQNRIAGIGNEYADEILYQAGIDPHHTVKDLSQADMKKIYTQMNIVLKYATKLRIQDVKHAVPDFFSQKDRKTFKSSYLQAHRHIDMMCPKNKKHTLKKVSIAGRTTYYCPAEQK
jgi:formamidopyrimidine-DNA glycosylase